MADVSFLARETSTSLNEVWNLPHSHYMAYLKHVVTRELQQSEEGKEILDKFNRYMNPRTEADLSTIRQLAGYQQKER